ncbi:hypothetical protein QJQ45_025732 [Haematococcus lacustris]|nr:hypothetical protein QJQ45_025732 [Haematococcus lacustris]
MNNDERKQIRLIIRQIHPDLFANQPYERQCNSDGLKSLNAYVDELSRGRMPRPTRLEFFVREGSQLRKVEAQLGASGSLGPLFYAFGLISADEMRMNDISAASTDTNFIGWLRDQVQEAVRTAEKHDVLKWHIRRLKNTLEEKYQLAAVQVGAEYAVSLLEQERQVEALKVLEYGLHTLSQTEGPAAFEGLTIQLYHPSSCPQETYSYIEHDGTFHMRTSYMKSYIGDDGALHLVADRDIIVEQLQALDVSRARMLTQVSFFWLKRVRDLTPAVTQLLGVRSVWCDTKTEQNSQKFVIWAGYLLEKKDEIRTMLGNRKFSFSIIVHADAQGQLINFHQSSPILNIRADCPPAHLMEFLASEGGVLASEAASEVHIVRAKEEALLERVRQVFEAKCVIKICMNDKVIEGAMKLLDNADVIKQAVDLKGSCIALDDCYEVWDSGFISIPYNFKITELSSMVRMLQSGQRPEDAEPPEAHKASAPASPPASHGAVGQTFASSSRQPVAAGATAQPGLHFPRSGLHTPLASCPCVLRPTARQPGSSVRVAPVRLRATSMLAHSMSASRMRFV